MLGILKERVDYLLDEDLNKVGIHCVEELIWDVNFYQARMTLKTGISSKNFKRLVENIQISGYLTECIPKDLKEKYHIDEYDVLKLLLKNGRMEFFTAKEIRKYQKILESEYRFKRYDKTDRVTNILQEIDKIGNRRLRAALEAESNLRMKDG